MAKLSARGRTVQVEATREYDAAMLTARAAAHGFLDSEGKPLTTWERVTRRLMSDGTILEKRDVRFQPDWLDKDGHRHSYGWKVYGKLKAGLTAEDFARVYRANTKSGKPTPWSVTTSCAHLPTAKVISQRRIVAAIESGNHVGFCTSCGSEQYGVEPDANGYKCESCGQMSVSGAENLALETL